MPVQDARDQPADLDPGEPRTRGLQILLVALCGGYLIPEAGDFLVSLMGLALGVLCPGLHTGNTITQVLDHC
jgi:hypothetical protein